MICSFDRNTERKCLIGSYLGKSLRLLFGLFGLHGLLLGLTKEHTNFMAVSSSMKAGTNKNLQSAEGK